MFPLVCLFVFVYPGILLRMGAMMCIYELLEMNNHVLALLAELVLSLFFSRQTASNVFPVLVSGMPAVFVSIFVLVYRCFCFAASVGY